jgi:hypothetical protein
MTATAMSMPTVPVVMAMLFAIGTIGKPAAPAKRPAPQAPGDDMRTPAHRFGGMTRAFLVSKHQLFLSLMHLRYIFKYELQDPA